MAHNAHITADPERPCISLRNFYPVIVWFIDIGDTTHLGPILKHLVKEILPGLAAPESRIK